MIVGGAVLATLIALYAAFEWGRLNAGYDSSAARAEAGQLRARIRELESQNKDHRLQLAATETGRTGQTRERAELARSIGDLQAEVARQARISRSIAGRGCQPAGRSGEDPAVPRVARRKRRRIPVEAVLGRPLRPEDAVDGTVKLTFEGTTAATPVNLDLGAVSTVTDGVLRFSYRYVATLEQAIKLPSGFLPARTTVELQPARKGASPVRQTFLWMVETG